MTLWLLGDQLHLPTVLELDLEHVLLIEASAVGQRRRYHPQKLILVLSAMRHFAEELRAHDIRVSYLQASTFEAGLREYATAAGTPEIVGFEHPSAGIDATRRSVVDAVGGSIELITSPLYLSTRAQFDAWAGPHETDRRYRQEQWYRHIRTETGILMDGTDPVGGSWNYDSQNRETPPADWTPPVAPRYPPDALTEAVAEELQHEYPQTWGAAAPFGWPVTRTDALDALDQFIAQRLPEFGRYQDAMVDEEWALAHSLLSMSINIGLLHPREAVDRAVAAFEADAAPINAVEGFVRQLVGWREFMRHVYRRAMPQLATANQLEQQRSLPPVYWDGDTDMRCLEQTVRHVYDRGYAHHIERLMVLSNFAMLYGAEPAAVNEWFHLGFVDAYHWVTTPNVIGMGSFGTDVLSSKPYAASANYISKMSDHCGQCQFDPTATTGADACPFNALYWNFLDEHEEQLRATGRMGLMYSHVDRKSEEEWEAIRERAEDVRQKIAAGEL
jgi:Uncharacterized protein related to deoxyribodipyrimidine photolyase